MRIIGTILCTLLLSSCFTYKEVEFNGTSDFNVENISKKQLDFSFNANIYNPNDYKIKVRSNDLDVLISDKKVGTAKIQKRVVIKKQTSDDYRVHVQADMKKFAGGGLKSIIRTLSGGSINLRIRGIIKARARGLGRKIEVDETKRINPSQLNL